MKIGELIQRLSHFSIHDEIMILDSFNGGGFPREINLGPNTRIITQEDSDECVDCEDIVGKQVAYIGYGCY